MARIVLATVNAKYIHAAFGLRWLRANLGKYRDESVILEYAATARPMEVVESILLAKPRIVGLGVYIWNKDAIAQICELLKAVAPEVKLVLGGPEVSHELPDQPWTQLADYVVQGEGESAFYQIVDRLSTGRPSLTRVHQGGTPDLAALCLPYQEYSDQDIAHRVVYVEASRGCPFRCAFCLSALDKKVRAMQSEPFFAAMQDLLDRGLRRFKFVDRTFNLSIDKSAAILDFFWERYTPGLFLHFEMIPDRLPDALKAKIARFPAGAVQLEVGIQSLNSSVNANIARRQKLEVVQQNFAFLRAHSGVHIHADLIVGLPGEDWESFLDGLDTLLSWGPQEIQLGILKRLRGAPLTAFSDDFGLRFSSKPPYEVLCSDHLSFFEVQHARRMAHLWDRLVNHGHFPSTLQEGLWKDCPSKSRAFAALTHWVHAHYERVHGWPLAKLALYFGQYLHNACQLPADQVAQLLQADLARNNQQIPRAIASANFELRQPGKANNKAPASGPPARQLRHLAHADQPSMRST